VVIGLSAALVAAVVFGIASIIQAKAVRRMPREDLDFRLIGDLLRSPIFLLSVAVTLVGFVLHLIALRNMPLFLAQSGVGASLAVTALLAMWIFHDNLSIRDWTAVAAVCVGLGMMAAGAGDVGEIKVSDEFIAGQISVIVAMVLLGLGAVRLKGVSAPFLLGSLAGLGFAGTGIGVRVLPSLHALDLLTSVQTYLVPISGALAFSFYSLALQRGSVTGATAPLIVIQTVTPALIGLFLLNDEVRDGWGAVALLGFLISGAGALALARFEAGPGHVPVTAPPTPHEHRHRSQDDQTAGPA
jgi:drug/metabolite transporter (DMT)-like permease